MIQVPLTRNVPTPGDEEHLARALASTSMAGNGPYANLCAEWLRERVDAAAVLMTPSCTAALELAALAFGIGPGDEVIMASFAFPSLASAFALRGATPVFVDIDPVTFGVDPACVEAAITPRTKAICALHYGGVACDMTALRRIAGTHGLRIVEDNAHGLLATLDGRPLGGFGDAAAVSFHATKNVNIGEGGALILNDPALVEWAEILQEKGTNRTEFLRGEASHYRWLTPASSPLMGELPAALLWNRLQTAGAVCAERAAICDAYRAALTPMAAEGRIEVPALSDRHGPDGHLACFLVAEPAERPVVIDALRAEGIQAAFHYVPLHSAPAGERHGRVHGAMDVTDRVAATIVRLPVWPGLPDHVPAQVADIVCRATRVALAA